jgi:NhaP-type Na+/H+ and K+/H+ antiporter
LIATIVSYKYSKTLGVVLLIVFMIELIYIEFNNYELAYIKKVYVLYLKGSVDRIKLNNYQSILEEYILKDLRHDVNAKKGHKKREKK